MKDLWTKEEDDALRWLKAHGFPTSDISGLLKRPMRGVRHRWQKLNATEEWKENIRAYDRARYSARSSKRADREAAEHARIVSRLKASDDRFQAKFLEVYPTRRYESLSMREP